MSETDSAHRCKNKKCMSRNIGEGGVTGGRTFSQEKAKAKPPTHKNTGGPSTFSGSSGNVESVANM